MPLCIQAIGGIVFIVIIAFYIDFIVRGFQRLFHWLFVREYTMTSDTIIRVVGWWKIYAVKKSPPPNVVHWSPSEDTEDDGESWKKG